MRAIQAITDFVFVQNSPCPADIIFLPGGPGDAPCLKAAELYRQGLAPLILPSGRFAIGKACYEGQEATEWAHMKNLLMAKGVPQEAILREDNASFTWENALFSRRVTDALGLCIRKALLVCKAHHARRALTYYEIAYPEADLRVCPAPIPGIDRQGWYLTQYGMDAVFGELNRFAQQMPTMEVFRRS
ncbi:MAG: YdcF family protein [Clostridia bacterium]|nr:YdcF family protein [Clostridia bacterium]